MTDFAAPSGADPDMEAPAAEGAADGASECARTPCHSVQTPTTPHPAGLTPPPPPGQPPQLPAKGKRPLGMGAELAPGTEEPAAGAAPGQGQGCAGPGPGQGLLATGGTSSASNASSGSSRESSSGSEDEALDAAAVEVEMEPAPPGPPPGLPPGPPPAEMAPLPPPGPPPSLHVDRAELKRGLPDASMPPSSDVDADGADAGADIEMSRAQAPGKRRRGDDVEESYRTSPASARWVWDRCLLQDKAAGMATLERRALAALDALHVGAVVDTAEGADDDA